MLQPLVLDTATFNVPQGVSSHIEYSLKLGLPELMPAICSHDGTFVIAGSGPSLALFTDEIKAEREKGRPICAVKGAHDHLISQGIEPDLFISIDPRDRRNNVQKESDNTVYLLASRCSPQVFDHLKDRKCMIWYAGSSQEENACHGKHKVKFMIGGTSTSGLRAVNVAYYLGFRKVVMYGMDSCNAPDGITKRVDGSLTGQTIDVVVAGRKFTCNIAMAEQAQAFQLLWQMMPDIQVEVKGDGLLAAILAERKRLGYWT
jgi:uncharacterized Rossmann fold enzyme